MYYHGGKKRVGYKIAQTIQKVVESQPEKYQTYAEPFCGMCGVFKHIPQMLPQIGSFQAGDINNNVITLWKAAQKGWKPPQVCSKALWSELKVSEVNSLERIFLGYATDFRGHFFGGYHDKKNVLHQGQSLMDIAKELSRVEFKAGLYSQFSKLKRAIIYCDPPYKGTKGYRGTPKFDNDEFWEWARRMSKDNLIFISEYQAPEDAILLAELGGKERLYYLGSL